MYRAVYQSWLVPEQGINGTQPSRRRSTSTVIDSNGIAYIFGGRVELDMASDKLILYNEMYIFNTIQVSWQNISAAPNTPSRRSHSAAVLLQNGKIVYIGGVGQNAPGNQTNLISMDEIQIFDTNTLSWSSHKANTPSTIQSRVGHTAVLTPDKNSLIIMGGTSSIEYNQTTVTPGLLMLDVQSEPFKYSIPKTSGASENNPPPLSFHTANVYRDYMIVAFGNITNGEKESQEVSSNIYLLYIPCMSWESTFISGK
ncbi:hypothetical protein C2G38_2143709, partial [Gigaspora rosea]